MLEIIRPVIASPEAMLFATVAIGVLLGRQKLGDFSFGNAAGTLIVGTLLGAAFGAAVPDISPTLKSIAFLFFVFAVGFQSGPQFFASLGRSTFPLVVLTLVVAAAGLATTIGVAMLLRLDQGTVIGLAAGGLTQAAMLGTAYGALDGLNLTGPTLQQIQGHAAIAFALTYIFGTIGVILFCSQIGPRLIRVDLRSAAHAFEADQDTPDTSGQTLDFRSLVARVFRVTTADGEKLERLDAKLGALAAVARVRRHGKDLAIKPDSVLRRGDLVAIQGYRPAIVGIAAQLGPEVTAEELVTDLLGEGVDVVASPVFSGLTLQDAVAKLGAVGHGLFLQRIRRHGRDIPVTAMTVLMPGDVLTMTGPADRLASAVPLIGDIAARSNRADISFLAAGLLCGVLIGLVTLTVEGLPITLSAGGGALVAGLIFGWWQARRPARANVPQAATQIMWDFGLAAFCALVGLKAGPQAVSAMGPEGLTILLAGILVTLVPQVVGLLFGHFVLRIPAVLLFGALAGAQTQDAAMLAASDVAESSAPALGFTVPYAIGNIVLTLLGPAIVVLT